MRADVWRTGGMTTPNALDARTPVDHGLAAAADRVLHAARTCGRGWRADDDVVVAWQGERGFYTNAAVVLSPAPDWPSVMRRVDGVVPTGLPVTLFSAAAGVPDLRPHGWVEVGHPPFMVRPADRAEATGRRPAPAELTITEVTDDAGLEVFERTLVAGYPEPNLEPYEFGVVHDGRVLGGDTHFFVGSVAGRPVATAAAHVTSALNWVEFVSTMPDARGRGYGEAVTWAATSVDPSLPAALIASDLGRPVYERMGYVTVGRWTLWHRPARRPSR
jgi:GNAT superfamily N-acetyltransferase